MSTPLDNFLARVDGAKRTGAGRYVFRCPAHKDKRASASLRELDDQRILVKCFAGCSAQEIVAAAGLTMSDLFPARETPHHVRPERRPFPASDVLRAVAFEALVVAAAASAMATGEPLSAVDRERLLLAVQRLQAAVTGAGL